jgi:peptide deformylase
MAIRKVARMGHPVLRRKCVPVNPEQITSAPVQQLIRDMLETMIEYDGVGLAAPQVYEPIRLVIAGGDEDADGKPMLRVLINPEITPTTDETLGMYEGCLSLPGLRGYVERPAAVHVEAYDERGQRIVFDSEGFPAIVLQHECDHLDGVLYPDRVTDLVKLGFEREILRFQDRPEPESAEEEAG